MLPGWGDAVPMLTARGQHERLKQILRGEEDWQPRTRTDVLGGLDLGRARL